MSISLTKEEDIPELVPLVNCAYRGLQFDGTLSDKDTSWTNEAHLVQGPRIPDGNPSELRNKENVNILKFEEDGRILGCIRLEKIGEICSFGILSVHPESQGRQIGSKLLDFSEDWAQRVFKCNRVQMTVISVRESLIQYYERRGFKDTGERIDFPIRKGSGVPKVPLDLCVLEKSLLFKSL